MFTSSDLFNDGEHACHMDGEMNEKNDVRTDVGLNHSIDFTCLSMIYRTETIIIIVQSCTITIAHHQPKTCNVLYFTPSNRERDARHREIYYHVARGRN